MEGRVFVSTWKKTTDGYRVWVKNRPKHAAEGKTFQEADEALWEVIMRATNDGENTREYEPPPPVLAELSAFLEPAIVCITGNAGGVRADPQGLFNDGYCERCGAPKGVRTDKALVADVGSEDVGAAMLVTKPSYARTRLHYFSERFLDLLKPSERDRFTWKPLERGPRARKVYYELVAADLVVPKVGVTGLPVAGAPGKPGGWRCGQCGFAVIPHYGSWGEAWPLDYVCGTDLPEPLPSCFALPSGRALSLCMRERRWRKIVGHKSTNGVVTGQVGVVPADRCDRAPGLRELGDVVVIQ
jgi:hypothetical protein